MKIESFGSRARVATLRDQLVDATQGNKDGIVANEAQPANGTRRTAPSNPILFALAQSLSVGLSKRDEVRTLSAFLASAEARWGTAVSGLGKPTWVADADWNAFRLGKAIALTRYERSPADVEDYVVHTNGSVDGHLIAQRSIFAQRYRAQGEANGTTVVIAPGFLETGRNYVEQAMLLSAQGYDVVVFDQQWAGLTHGGVAGGIDRGFGIARDVAAVAADAATRTPGTNVVLVGTSMGGGPGAYGALHLNAAGRIDLGGRTLPTTTSAVLLAPFFGMKSTLINETLAATGRVPLVNAIPLPAFGLPILSSDRVTLKKLAAHGVTEKIAGRASAFHASTADLKTLRDELATNPATGPKAPIYIVHAANDTLADHAATAAWAQLLGPTTHLATVDSDNHVTSENPLEQTAVLDGLRWVASQRR